MKMEAIMKKIISILLLGILLMSVFGAVSAKNCDKIDKLKMIVQYNTVKDSTSPIITTSEDMILMILGEGNFNSYSLGQFNFDYEYITRDRIMEIADGFLTHEWYPTEENIFHDTFMRKEVDTPDRDTYTDWPNDHGWKSNQTANGLPYQWGGFSSISGYNLSNPQDFDEQYTGTGSYEGRIHFAGDINTNDYCERTCGLDCSGFVSRCWNLPMKHATYTFLDIVSPVRLEELQYGDILNIPRYHVILFKEFVDEEKTLIRTIECGGPAPNVNEHVYKITSVGDNSFSVTLDRYSTSYQFGLYRYEFIENAPRTPTLNGPTSGNAENEYSYMCVTTDPEEDMVSYCIDWGDESEFQWFGPSNSGESINISHIWEKTGTFIIRAKARDINHIESGWTSFEVKMPKNKAINIPFLYFLENHLYMFPLLRQLLDL